MTTIIHDCALEERLIAERQAAGLDKHDEVWDGVYVMSPMANNEHQRLVTELATILNLTVGWQGLGRVFPGVNVSDQHEDWTRNYRCPDVAVFLKDTRADDRGAYWYGGPDLVIEITSPNERAADKLDFYAAVSTSELLVVDRDPWSLSQYNLKDGTLPLVGESNATNNSAIVSHVVPLQFKLVFANSKPSLEISHTDGEQSWTIDPSDG